MNFCILQKSCPAPYATRGFGDPQVTHLQPASPELTEQPTKHVAALTAEHEIDREIIRQAGCGNIVVVDAADNELSYVVSIAPP